MQIDDIRESLQPVQKGGSYEDVYKLLYYAVLLKYSTPNHLKQCFKTAFKYATKNKLKTLVELGFLQAVNKEKEIFTATSNAFEFLDLLGQNMRLLPNAPPKGEGAEIYNTDVFIQALKLPNFKALLYPNFGYVIPDALLVLAEDGRYQLNFLEIEAEKTYWDDHLLKKYEAYNKLATDEKVYNYWIKRALDLKLPRPTKEQFKFQVMVIGNIQKDFGDGWIWYISAIVQ